MTLISRAFARLLAAPPAHAAAPDVASNSKFPMPDDPIDAPSRRRYCAKPGVWFA